MSHFVRLKRQKDAKIPTKIVMRRLPPNFTSKIFKEIVSPIPEYNYLYFVNADRSEDGNSFSRVYINFARSEDTFKFREKYDNYVFIGPKGLEYPAVVEYAPFQKIPRDRFFQKRDIKCGTIQNNEYYLQFVNNLTLAKFEKNKKSEYDLQFNTQLNESHILTPLIKYVSAKKSEQLKGCTEKREAKQQISETCSMVFVNSSVKKSVNRGLHLKRYS